jgi:site-specific recombinase XerC
VPRGGVRFLTQAPSVLTIRTNSRVSGYGFTVNRRLATKIATDADGSLRDVQELARHSSLQMTQKYIEVSEGAMKRVVG